MVEIGMGEDVVTDLCNRWSVTSCTSLIPKPELWNALKSEFFWAIYQFNCVSCVKLPLEYVCRMFMKCKWTLCSYSQDNSCMQTYSRILEKKKSTNLGTETLLLQGISDKDSQLVFEFCFSLFTRMFIRVQAKIAVSLIWPAVLLCGTWNQYHLAKTVAD